MRWPRTHAEVGDAGEDEVGEGLGERQAGASGRVQQTLDGLLAQRRGRPHGVKVGQGHHGHIGQWCVQGPHALLLGHQPRHRAVHLPRGQRCQRGHGAGGGRGDGFGGGTGLGHVGDRDRG